MLTKFPGLRPLRLRSRLLPGYVRNEDGYISVEAIIVLPVMLWLFGVGWVYFDAFRQQSVAQKANYVIADMISRETDAIDQAYVSNAYSMVKLLTRSTDTQTDLRMAVVSYQSASDDWTLVWSTASGNRAAMTQSDVTAYRSRLPMGTDNEQLIIVETWEDYSPAFDVGLGSFEIQSYSFTSPRYAPQIPFSNS